MRPTRWATIAILAATLAFCGCAARLDTHDMGVGASAVWEHSEAKTGPGLGVDVSGPEVAVALDPLNGLLNLFNGSGSPDASDAIAESKDLEARLMSAISSEIAKGAEADQAKLDELQAAVAALGESRREVEESPPLPSIAPPPIGGSFLQWLMWIGAAIIAVIAWWKNRKGAKALLAAAVAKARDLLKQYDDAPYTAEDVVAIEKAKADLKAATNGTPAP